MTEHYDQREAMHNLRHHHGDGVTKPEGTPEVGRGENPSPSPVAGAPLPSILEMLVSFSIKHFPELDGPGSIPEVALLLERIEERIDK